MLKSGRPYCLGLAESPAADFSLVWLNSSRSDPLDVMTLPSGPQVPCPSLVMAYIQTSDQSEASIAAAAGFPAGGGGGWWGGGLGAKKKGQIGLGLENPTKKG